MIHFFYPILEDIEYVEGSNPPHWFFNNGRRAWILQTYMELKNSSINASIGIDVPKVCVVFCHRTDTNELLRHLTWRHKIHLVCIRADKKECTYSDSEIVQNMISETSSKHYFLPHWPQPGLIGRQHNRGNEIRFAGFKGSSYEIHPELLSEHWKMELDRRNIEWYCSPLPPKNLRDKNFKNDWHDFRHIDVFIAIRGTQKGATKPATKLINAWLAGVPAILGPEPAYQELRISKLDYLEASDPQQAIEQLDKLIEDPTLYLNMIENGKIRASEYEKPLLLEKWISFINRLEATEISKVPFLVRKIFKIIVK
jgi:hypothetical protein